MIRTNEECCFDLRYSSLVRHHHAFLPPRQTNKPSKKLNATTPPTTFTPPPRMHAYTPLTTINSINQKPSQIVNERFSENERKKETYPSQHSKPTPAYILTPGAKIWIPPSSSPTHPGRRRRRLKLQGKGEERMKEFGVKGGKGKGKGACLFLLIIQTAFFSFPIFVFLCIWFVCFSAFLLHFIPEACTRVPFCKETTHRRKDVWRGYRFGSRSSDRRQVDRCYIDCSF
jgi:hypothetical protein